MNRFVAISLVLLVAGIIIKSPFSGVSYGPGVIAPDAPEQKSTNIEAFWYKDIEVIPQATFDVEAKVLSKENYTFGPESIVSPVDLALGWGRMSDESILQDISISQRNRFYYWRVNDFPIPKKEIQQNSANMHMIPANDEVARQLKKVNPGELVRFYGYLVNLKRDNGWHWNSSTSRKDSGAGACELVWVEEFEIVPESELQIN